MSTFVMTVGAGYRVGMYPGDAPSEENDGEVAVLYHFALFAEREDAVAFADKVMASGGWNPAYWSENPWDGETVPRKPWRKRKTSAWNHPNEGWHNVSLNRPGQWS